MTIIIVLWIKSRSTRPLCHNNIDKGIKIDHNTLGHFFLFTSVRLGWSVILLYQTPGVQCIDVAFDYGACQVQQSVTRRTTQRNDSGQLQEVNLGHLLTWSHTFPFHYTTDMHSNKMRPISWGKHCPYSKCYLDKISPSNHPCAC